MKKLPLGIQNFRKIIEEGYVYADKTRYVYDLMNDASYYFLSRPRRFGKSLLLDTIAEAFGGDRELFSGLYIYETDYRFEKHPVLRLDMSNIANKTPEVLEESLSNTLKNRIKAEGLDIDFGLPSDIFKTLIEALYNKYEKRVVVLIDEYDKPILDHIENHGQAEEIRKILKGFYGILKSMDPFLRFTFITGVSKFTKTSVFSGLNNLFDITMNEKYANVCGILKDDLKKYFGENIAKMESLERFKNCGGITENLLEWYDGYSWDGETRVINPYSLLYFFSEEEFSNYWYRSGTPAFLIGMLKKKPSSFLELKNVEIGEIMLDAFDFDQISLAPLLFQTGYLTVEKKIRRGLSKSYSLTMPNLEVREAFYLNIVSDFTEKGGVFTESAYWNTKKALENGDLEAMLKIMKGLFASIPYQLHVDNEAYYHSIFYAFMSLLGFDMDLEVSVSKGRIDAVLELADKIYIMEFKYVKYEDGASPESKQKLFAEALKKGMKQIENKGYSDKYAGNGKKIYRSVFAFLGRDEIEMAYTAMIP